MFAKLLKHEWKDTAGLLGILSLCVLGAGVLGGFAIRAIDYFSGKVVNDGMAAIVAAGFAFLVMGLFMAMVAYAVGTEIYLLYRFYKTRFTDQGYLTFTLPVSNRSIFLSAYVNILAWLLISVVTVFAAVVIAIAIGGVFPTEDLEYIMGEVMYSFEEAGLGWYMVCQFLGSLASAASGVMIMMVSITAGAVVAKKHKILAAIGIYYGQSIVLGILASVIQTLLLFLSFSADVSENAYMALSCLTYVLQAAWGVGAYFLSMHLINKKLNLP